ncbi:MAG: hypothetical protein H0V12_12165 [Chloroflexi bacterium]|nr:hypothetical protein [Chloroflexota bacterium]
MYGRDRVANMALFGLALGAWVLVGVVFTSYSPRDDAGVQLAGAAGLGLAAGITSAPLFWLVGFARQRRIAYRGDWLRAGRRALWVAVVVMLFVVLRTQGAFSIPIALFVVVMVLFVELTLSVRR